LAPLHANLQELLTEAVRVTDAEVDMITSWQDPSAWSSDEEDTTPARTRELPDQGRRVAVSLVQAPNRQNGWPAGSA
jgi:hypothetical protein